ncbi:hypothetical protein PIB30_008010 [Stylosanthes scabra]|uniref:Uncharacterized protein n=1 Tax=Stylosanthes scabra TaxID=79078 RepID=A0ABU6V323_9FABA|nr:hypothetical protein [Stylosanthes scabra]
MGNQKENVSRKGKTDKLKKAAPKERIQKKKDQGHDFTCVPLSVSTIFHKCLNKDQDKMKIVEELGFGSFRHIPLYYLKHKVLKRIFNRFDPYNHTIHAVAGVVEITTKKMGKNIWPKVHMYNLLHATLQNRFGTTYPERIVSKDLNDRDSVFKYFQGIKQAALKNLIFNTQIDTDENKDLFKRVFLLCIQKCFLLPTSAANISPKALPTIFNLENTRHQNWALHIHNFLLEEVQKAKENNTSSVSGCCFAWMVIYFHEIHFGKNSRKAKAQPPWIQYWTGKTL